jgi:hypothetical protein
MRLPDANRKDYSLYVSKTSKIEKSKRPARPFKNAGRFTFSGRFGGAGLRAVVPSKPGERRAFEKRAPIILKNERCPVDLPSGQNAPPDQVEKLCPSERALLRKVVKSVRAGHVVAPLFACWGQAT